jgi:hypothetical protein
MFHDDSIPQQGVIDGAVDLADVQETRPAEVEPVAPSTRIKQAKRRAGSKGGKAPRAVALIGLGLPAEQTPAINLRDADAQIALLEAVALAVATGRTSGMVASSLVAIVKAANQVLMSDQAEEIAELTRRIEALADSRVVNVRR